MFKIVVATIWALSVLPAMNPCRFWWFCLARRVKKMAQIVEMASITAVMTLALLLISGDRLKCRESKIKRAA